MSTRYMYRYTDGLQKRYVNNLNKEYRGHYNYIAMFMSALAGKLNEPIQFNEDGTIHKQTLEDKIKDLKNKGGGRNG